MLFSILIKIRNHLTHFFSMILSSKIRLWSRVKQFTLVTVKTAIEFTLTEIALITISYIISRYASPDGKLKT